MEGRCGRHCFGRPGFEERCCRDGRISRFPGGFLVRSIEVGPGLRVNRFHMLTTYIAFLR